MWSIVSVALTRALTPIEIVGLDGGRIHALAKAVNPQMYEPRCRTLENGEAEPQACIRSQVCLVQHLGKQRTTSGPPHSLYDDPIIQWFTKFTDHGGVVAHQGLGDPQADGLCGARGWLCCDKHGPKPRRKSAAWETAFHENLIRATQ